jgi:hypothetical protein
MIAVNAPWIVSGLFQTERAVSGLAAVEAFASRGEGHLPTPLTLLGLGGVWNADVVPDSRLGWGPVLWFAVLGALVAVGVPQLRKMLGHTATIALAALALFCLLVALSGAFVPNVVADITATVPGAALFRDGSRYLGPVALVEALALGLGVGWCMERVKSSWAAGFLVVGACLAPVVVMPDLAWGAAGRLEPVDYPETWEAARDAVVEYGGGGNVLYLPLAPYRAFPWNESRPVLDPAPRFFPSNALASDALHVDGELVQTEEPRAALAERLLRAGDLDGLRQLGVGYVVATADLPEVEAWASDADLTPLYSSVDISVYVIESPDPQGLGVARVVGLTGAWVLLLIAVSTGVWLRTGHRIAPAKPAVDST